MSDLAPLVAATLRDKVIAELLEENKRLRAETERNRQVEITGRDGFPVYASRSMSEGNEIPCGPAVLWSVVLKQETKLTVREFADIEIRVGGMVKAAFRGIPCEAYPDDWMQDDQDMIGAHFDMAENDDDDRDDEDLIQENFLLQPPPRPQLPQQQQLLLQQQVHRQNHHHQQLQQLQQRQNQGKKPVLVLFRPARSLGIAMAAFFEMDYTHYQRLSKVEPEDVLDWLIHNCERDSAVKFSGVHFVTNSINGALDNWKLMKSAIKKVPTALGLADMDDDEVV